MKRILVIDDEAPNREVLEALLAREGFSVRLAASGREGLERLRGDGADVVVTDLKMPGMDGLDVLRAIKAIDEDVQVVVVTAFGTLEVAVEAMREGAYDVLAKPLKRAEIVRTVQRALETRALRLENRALRARLGEATEGALIGDAPSMRAVLAEIDQVASSDATVLLTGASGSGKGRLARLLHERSRRRHGPFVTVHCAALPESLLESELFGYEAGAFTGALRRKAGRFDLASSGTLFLDEVTEIPPVMQVKLLRVLQEGEYERVGGAETLRADVRVVAATNRDVEAEVAAGRLREDLYYRLNVIRVAVPSLAERAEDVPLLAWRFVDHFARKNGREVAGLTPAAMEALTAWTWPGNVRELENAMERAVVLCRGSEIDIDDLPPALRRAGGKPRFTVELGTPIKDVERRMIEDTVRHCHGDRTLAASLLGITSRTIYRREVEWGTRQPGEAGDADEDVRTPRVRNSDGDVSS
jgi:two-component system response regulator HydG